jgi:hypothetical protein
MNSLQGANSVRLTTGTPVPTGDSERDRYLFMPASSGRSAGIHSACCGTSSIWDGIPPSAQGRQIYPIFFMIAH